MDISPSEIGNSSEGDSIVSEILENKSVGFIDSGQDSSVYRRGSSVYKIYDLNKKNPSVRQLTDGIKFYVQVVNDARRLAETKKYSFTFENKEYDLQINPVDRILPSEKHQKVVSVSPFVDGQRSDQTQLAKDAGFQTFLNRVSIDINDQLGVAGVNIINYNTMVSENSLIVTDLCAQIPQLRQFGKRKFS